MPTTTATTAITILLADDHCILRDGLRSLLRAEPDFRVVAEAADGREAVRLAAELSPDVVVMDLTMAEMDGIAATRELATREKPPRVLVLTMHAEEEYLLPVLEAGAAGYLVKSVADRELIEAVRTVARGDLYVSPSAGRVLARGIRKKDEHSELRARYDKLTDREQAVLRLVAAGFTAPEIGEQLFISPKTVDTYKQRVNEKLGLQHRNDYVTVALKLGLLTLT
jgi:DNA-binding NarL/FixJ family response regulator